MKKIWLIRHGQSVAQTPENDDDVNPPLTELGKTQAKRLVEPMKKIKCDRILISPLTRAWQTFQLSQAKADSIEFDTRVLESEWGIPNFYKNIISLKLPDIAEPDSHNAWLESVDDRTNKLLDNLIMVRPEEKIMIFAHWAVSARILQSFIGLDTTKKMVNAPMDNVAISLLEVDDELNKTIRYWNDRAHVIDLLQSSKPD